MATSTTASQTLSVTLTGITGQTLEFSTRRNVKKRIADIKYLSSLPSDAVSLSYAGSEEITVGKNLYIGDRSDRVYPNSKNKEDSQFITTGSSIPITHRNILVTQKFANSRVSEIPLYFKHVLSSSVDIDSIKIFDKNFDEVSEEDHYLVERITEYDEATGAPITPTNYLSVDIYNSLESTYDYSTGEYEVYYIQYVDSNSVTHTVLLDNVVAYRDAEPDDIWYLTLSLAPWATAYFIEVSGNSYSVNVPSSGEKTAIRYTGTSRIYTEAPSTKTSDSLWYPRVSNGSFSFSYGPYTYTYEIAEFENQPFNPISPYKTASRMVCNKVSSTILKVPHTDIENGGFYQYLEILIYDADNEVIYALTQNSSKVGSRYKDLGSKDVLKSDGTYVLWSSTEILSIDKYSGFVNLSLSIQDYWSMKASYSYVENFYEMTNLNMNPIFDSTVHTQIRVPYIIPRSIVNNNLSHTSSLKYLKVNTAGLIEETNQDGNSSNENISFTTMRGDVGASSIIGVLGLHYSWRASTLLVADSIIDSGETLYVESTSNFPPSGWIRVEDNSGIWRYTKYTSKTSTTLILSTDSNDLPSSAIPLTYDVSNQASIQVVNFIDERSVLTVRSVTSEIAKIDTVYRTYPVCASQYLILSEMSINPNQSINDVVLLDTRIEGGGIDETLYDSAKAIQPEVQWFYDYLKFDGQPTPGNAVTVIKLPISILDTFTKEEVEDIVEDNVAYGIKPIIRFYEYFPLVTSVLPVNDSTIPVTIDDFNIPYAFILNNSNDGNLRITWDQMGSEFAYDIWYSYSKEGPWSKHNKIRVVDSIYDENTYVLDSLTQNAEIYVKITCIDKYNSWWCSYSSYDSVEGGYGHEEDPPTFPFGNIMGFKVEVL